MSCCDSQVPGVLESETVAANRRTWESQHGGGTQDRGNHLPFEDRSPIQKCSIDSLDTSKANGKTQPQLTSQCRQSKRNANKEIQYQCDFGIGHKLLREECSDCVWLKGFWFRTQRSRQAVAVGAVAVATVSPKATVATDAVARLSYIVGCQCCHEPPQICECRLER